MTNHLRINYFDEAELERLKKEDEAEAADHKLAKTITARERGILKGMPQAINLKEKDIIMSENKYPYLASEDSAVCHALRLTEDDYLALHGGLAKYSQFRLDRQKARQNGYDIPQLSGDINTYLPTLKFTQVTEKEYAKVLIADTRKQVAGGVQAIKMDKNFSALAAKEASDKAAMKERDLKELRREASLKFGWDEDSQSAKDWAEAELKRKSKRY